MQYPCCCVCIFHIIEYMMKSLMPKSLAKKCVVLKLDITSRQKTQFTKSNPIYNYEIRRACVLFPVLLNYAINYFMEKVKILHSRKCIDTVFLCPILFFFNSKLRVSSSKRFKLLKRSLLILGDYLSAVLEI